MVMSLFRVGYYLQLEEFEDGLELACMQGRRTVFSETTAAVTRIVANFFTLIGKDLPSLGWCVQSMLVLVTWYSECGCLDVAWLDDSQDFEMC